MNTTLMLRSLVPATIVLVAACEVPTTSISTDEQRDSARPPSGECAEGGEPCSADDDICCAGSYCESFVYSPEDGRCVPLRPDGSPCGAASQCEGAWCNTLGRCGPEPDEEPCLARGETCAGSGCCADSFCETNAYVLEFGSCAPKRGAGAFCMDAGECRSGRCEDHLCASTDPAAALRFERIYREVLVPNGCTGAYCHGGGAGSMSLQSVESAYDALVGTPAEGDGCGAAPRVAPGSARASLLFAKVAPGVEAPCGQKMPPTAGGLSAAAASLIARWIDEGALP